MTGGPPDGARHRRTVGDGWDRVVIAAAARAAPSQGQPGNAPDLSALGTPVSGPWGSGRLISTAVATAIVTDDGRIAAGRRPRAGPHRGARPVTATPAPGSSVADRPPPTPSPLRARARGLRKTFGAMVAVDGVDLDLPVGCDPRDARTERLRQDHADPDAARADPPDRGHVELLGHADDLVAALPDVGALVEGPGFHPFLSGRDNLLRAAAAEPRLDGDLRVPVDAALERVGLTDAADGATAATRSGMKQRLGLAAALLVPRRLVVLDEPTNGLDPAGTRDVRRVIAELHDAGATVLLSSHLLAEVEAVCTHVAVLQRGPLLVSGELPRCSTPGAGELVVTTADVDAALARCAGRRPTGATGRRRGRRRPGRSTPEVVAPLVRAGVGGGEVHRRPRPPRGALRPPDRGGRVTALRGRRHRRSPRPAPLGRLARRGAALGAAPPADARGARAARPRCRWRSRSGWRRGRAAPGAAWSRTRRAATGSSCRSSRWGWRWRCCCRWPSRSAAADAIAGEAATGTLRGLLLAPVGAAAAGRHEVGRGGDGGRARGPRRSRSSGWSPGWSSVGGPGALITLSGTTLGVGEALGRIALVAAWTVGPARGDRRGGARGLDVHRAPAGRARLRARRDDRVRGAVRDPVAGVAAAAAADVRLHGAGTDVLRDPMPAHGLVESTLRALCYLALGGGFAAYRMLRRDA